MSGPNPNADCVFPFEFNGVIYKSCKHDLSDNTRWCSTKVDANGTHISNEDNWGNCDENCSKGCHVKVQNEFSEVLPCVFPYTIKNSVGVKEIVNQCTKQYPNKPEDSTLICYTKKNITTNEAIIGRGDWGVCEQEYCPVLSTSSRFSSFNFQG